MSLGVVVRSVAKNLLFLCMCGKEKILHHVLNDKDNIRYLDKGIKLFEFLCYHSVCRNLNSLFFGCRNHIEQ